jgi:hypothetical protein
LKPPDVISLTQRKSDIGGLDVAIERQASEDKVTIEIDRER